MNVRWTKDLKTDEDKEKFKELLHAAKPVMTRLRGLVYADLEHCRKSRIQPEYTDPSWAYRQADLNAEERTLQKVLDLLDGVC